MRFPLLSALLNFWPIRRLVSWPVRRHLDAFDRATRRPREVQEGLLARIVGAQAGTAFGRDHHFHSIAKRDDFRRQVGILRYEDLEPYIARCRMGELTALLSEPCVHMFAMTSGTTASRKYIPVTPQYLRDYKRGWNMWGLKVFQDHPEVRLRPMVQLAGDWEEFRTDAGIPCGALTGLTAHTQKRIVRWLYCVPAAAAKINDSHAKYYVALRLSMPRTIGMIIAANPSTLVNLARTGDQHKEALIRDLFNGTLHSGLELTPEIRAELAPRLTANPERARELERIVSRTGTLYPRDFWGGRKFVVGTWMGGSMGAYLRHFPRYFGEAPVRDIGLLASEGRMTVPLADGSPSGVLDITSHYFEFIPEEEIDRPDPTVLSAHELEVGRRYFILLTTAYGLYRYNIFDLIQVTGFHNQTPLVEFLSKGSHFANITGEKLSEYQVTKAMAALTSRFVLSLTSYSVAPCWDEERPYYGLFIENGDLPDKEVGRQLAEALEQALMETNTEYASKRASLRLDPIRLELIAPGSWAKWDRQRLAKTRGSLEQYKHPCLINDLKFRESIEVEEEISALSPQR